MLWRVASLLVALHAGPLSYAPPEGSSLPTFLDGWGRTITDDRGVLMIHPWIVVSLLVLEMLGAWLRRGSLLRATSNRKLTTVARKDAP